MRTVFFLASDLGPAAHRLGLLAAALPSDRFRAVVGVVGPPTGPTADGLRQAGIPVHPLPVKYLFDLRGIGNLRRAIAAENPSIVHAWGPAAVRAARHVTGSRLVVSAAADIGGGFSGWLTARSARRADRVIPTTWAEGSRYRQLGVPAESLTRIAPGVVPPAEAADPAAVRKELGVPPGSRLIFAGGRLDTAAGLKDAVMAFDILRYDTPDLYLVLLGTGPERQHLEDLGRALAFDDFRVRFAGDRPDLPAVLGLSEVVWATRACDGLDLPLLAMAAGRPVVGWRVPELAEVIDHAETGRLVPPGDRAELAAKTRVLLDEPSASRFTGDTARLRVLDRFPLSRAVEQFARLYEELADPGERGA
jgi:glycosyltransferase involved in cell wall biosynthesis